MVEMPYQYYYTLLSLIAFLSLTILLYKWLINTKKNQPPSPRKLPIIGNLHQLGDLPHRSLRAFSQKHGDMMLLHLGSKPTLVVCSAKYAEEIMKTNDIIFANRPISRVSTITIYNNRDIACASYGDYWKKMRSICVLHMLSVKNVQSFRKIRQEGVCLMVEQIAMSTPSMAVNLTNAFVSFTFRVVSRVSFGRKYSGEEGGGNLNKLLCDLNDAFGSAGHIGDFIPWLGWIDHVNGVLGKATRVAKAFDEFLEKILEEHIDRVNDHTKDKEEIVKDLVDVLLEIQKNDPSLERDSIKALLMDMLIGGIKSTSTLVEWAMSELFLHPGVMKLLQDEVRGFLKAKSTIDEDDLENMPYLKAVIKETLRLHPSAPLLIGREASKDVKVNNYNILAGTRVIINAWAIQRHPSSWDNPEEFQPQRFLNTSTSVDMKGNNNNNNNNNGFEFIPFGAGRRGCPARFFATVTAELALANVVAHFDWELLDKTQEGSFMDEAFGPSVNRQHPLFAIPTPYYPN